MQRPAIIRTPLPTPEEVAAELGISKRRVRELRELVDSIENRGKTKAIRKRKSRR
jgi:hypothetical protein